MEVKKNLTFYIHRDRGRVCFKRVSDDCTNFALPVAGITGLDTTDLKAATLHGNSEVRLNMR
jgi:hypothetical protein